MFARMSTRWVAPPLWRSPGNCPLRPNRPLKSCFSTARCRRHPCGAENPAIVPEVEQAVHRMMAKRPADRFSSMAELADELKTLIDGLLQSNGRGMPSPATSPNPIPIS